jgi:hypothetical protein
MFHLYLTRTHYGWRIEHPSGVSYAVGFIQKEHAYQRLRREGYEFVSFVTGGGFNEHWQRKIA